jgi:peptidoglycan-N-acetylglucosamine deacetylase
VGLLGVGLAVTMTGCGALLDAASTATTTAAPYPPPQGYFPPTTYPPPGTTPPSRTAPPSVGCVPRTTEPSASTGPPATSPPATSPAVPTGDPEPPQQPFLAGTGGRPQILRHGPEHTRQIALTIDDGACADCVAGYVEFARRTGIHLTFCPNGIYAGAWAPHARVLRALIERGQLQIINHTFNHPDLRTLSSARIQEELESNEKWVVDTFGVSTRPYYRPPFGFHNPRVNAIAAEVGMDRVVLWNGSFSDSTLITPHFLMEQAHRYLHPGVIMLGHANHPTVLGLFRQITRLICERQLEPVTLDEMFGTRRPPLPRRTRVRQVPISRRTPRRPVSGDEPGRGRPV